MPAHANRPRDMKIAMDVLPKQRREKTVAELTPASRNAWGRGCRCSVTADRQSEILVVRSHACPHHRGIGFWHVKEKRGWA